MLAYLCVAFLVTTPVTNMRTNMRTNPPVKPVPPVETISVDTIDRGNTSDVASSRQAVARTPVEWRELWQAHAPSRPAPAVDFAKTMVVAVFLGTQPSAGYAVNIVRTRAEGGALIVEYVEKRPAPDAITAQVLTSPFHIAAIPAHAGEVRFEKVPK